MQCPACHFEQPAEHTSCECCGLIFAKYDPDAAKPLPVLFPEYDKPSGPYSSNVGQPASSNSPTPSLPQQKARLALMGMVRQLTDKNSWHEVPQTKENTVSPWGAAVYIAVFAIPLFLAASGVIKASVDIHRYGWVLYTVASVLGMLSLFQVVIGIRDNMNLPRDSAGMNLAAAALMFLIFLMMQVGWIYFYFFDPQAIASGRASFGGMPVTGSSGKGLAISFMFLVFQIVLTPLNILLFRSVVQKAKIFFTADGDN